MVSYIAWRFGVLCVYLGMNQPTLTQSDAIEALLKLSDNTGEALRQAKAHLLQELAKHEPCKFYIHTTQGLGELTFRLFIKPAEVTEQVPTVNFYRFGYTLVAAACAEFKLV